MERIVAIESVRGGRPTIAGSRITVAEVLEKFGAGMTETDMIQSFPNLSVEDVRAALAYAAREFDHPVIAAQ
jgi:uncharacterized protein (DUF433 family)